MQFGRDSDGDHYWALMNDIDASETRYWSPQISPEGDTLYYQGLYLFIPGYSMRELDGRGHVIRNLYANLGHKYYSSELIG